MRQNQPARKRPLSFQQKMYGAFVIAIALTGAAALITYLNDFTFNMTAVYLTLVAIPFLTVGIPAAIIRHTGIFDPEKESRQAAGPAAANQPNQSNGDTPCAPHP